MTGARDIAQLCVSSNLTGIVANKIEQRFYSVYKFRPKRACTTSLERH